MKAIRNGKTDFVKVLIKIGADVNAKTKVRGCTVCACLCERECVCGCMFVLNPVYTYHLT